jgi:hypothetical protein
VLSELVLVVHDRHLHDELLHHLVGRAVVRRLSSAVPNAGSLHQRIAWYDRCSSAERHAHRARDLLRGFLQPVRWARMWSLAEHCGRLLRRRYRSSERLVQRSLAAMRR